MPLSCCREVRRGAALRSRISRHIDRRARDGPASHAATHAVANLAARSRGRAVEGFHGCGEVVCFGLERDHALDGLHLKPVCRALVGRGKLLHHRSLGKSHIVFVGRENLAGVVLGSLLDERKQA